EKARAPAGADWRDVLRKTGAEPMAPVAKRETPSAPLPAEGLSVGDGDRQLFGGTLAHLDSLAAIAGAVASCTRCAPYSTATNPVPGQGNPNASLMIVGEAPGATEEQQGLAFVGAAGRLLT